MNFIFSGSRNHMLIEMFNSAKRPFFSSTLPVYLNSIPRKEYTTFIRKNFKRGRMSIETEAIDFILDWTRVHTYYTQTLCNKVYTQNNPKIDLEDVYHACDSLLREQENVFYYYRNLLTQGQWKLLKSIAKEDEVHQPTGFDFISTYNLGNPASVKRSLESLINKEMVIRKEDENGNYYQVYDCFLSRWLER